MKFDLSIVLLDHKGRPMKETPQPDSPDATAGSIAVASLLTMVQGDDKLDFAAKTKRGLLAFRIEQSPAECDLTAEEITQIKECAGRIYGPLTCAALHNAFRGL